MKVPTRKGITPDDLPREHRQVIDSSLENVGTPDDPNEVDESDKHQGNEPRPSGGNKSLKK